MSTHDKLVAVEKFFFTADAHLASALLKESGVTATVVGDQLATSLSWLGTQATEVMVHAKDVDRACEILAEAKFETEKPTYDRWSTDVPNGWCCPSCEEVNELHFEVCWSCLKVRPDDAKLAPLDPPSTPTSSGSAPPDSQDDSPYRPPQSKTVAQAAAPADPELERLRQRAWNAMVFGLTIPPLFFYGLALYVESRGGDPGPLKLVARIVLGLTVAWVIATVVSAVIS